MKSDFSIDTLMQKSEQPESGVLDPSETVAEAKPYDNMTDHDSSSAEEAGTDGPIKQTLSYFDVLLPHIQMICNASSTTPNEDCDSTPSSRPPRKSQPPGGDWVKFLQNSLIAGPSTSSATSFPNGFFFQQMQKTKRVRTAFSPCQLIQLEKAFKLNHYVIGNERKTLAKKLSLSETQVITHGVTL